MEEKHEMHDPQTARVVGWDPQYRTDFVRLNVAWIQKYFFVEETDRRYLYHPEEKTPNRAAASETSSCRPPSTEPAHSAPTASSSSPTPA